MKTGSNRIIAAVVSLAGAASVSVHAQVGTFPPAGPFYVNVDAGANILQDLRIKNTGARLSTDLGTRTDVSVGYQIIDPLALEFEAGLLWNSLDSDHTCTCGTTYHNRADLYQIPLLGNLIYRVPLGPRLSAYAGGGAGGVASTLQLRQYTSDGGWRHDHDTDFTFAYQGLAGVKYAFNPAMELGLGYKFLGTLDHSWFENSGQSLQTGSAYSHAFLASFTFRF